jgi:hypothetical protein
MLSPRPVEVQNGAIDAYLSRRQPPRGPAYLVWFSRRVLLLSLFLYVVPIAGGALTDGRIPRVTDFTGSRGWIQVLTAMATALIIVLVVRWQDRRMRKLARPVLMQQLHRGWSQVMGPGWARRSLLSGVTLAAVITATAGLVLAFLLPGVELIKGSRLLTLLALFGGTLMWAIPGAFLVRWGLVRYYRRFMRSDGGLPEPRLGPRG